MSIIVTGGAGFIGSNIVRGLNARGVHDIIVVDDLTDGSKFRNLRELSIADYIDKDVFYPRFADGAFGKTRAVFHDGACSDTMEQDGRYMMQANYTCSKMLLDACQAQGTALLYASSAATYGASSVFVEDPEYERPLNVYGYSKLLFDQVVRRMLPTADIQIVGFRYFNVYGFGEGHKGRMASVAYHHLQQLRETGSVRLFGAYDGYEPGQQARDFVHIDDVVAVNLWFFDNPGKRGIFNLGTGRAQPFNDVARSTVNSWRALNRQDPLTLEQQIAAGLIDYIDFPEALKGKYQSFTQADIRSLRDVGCERDFATVEQGVTHYMSRMTDQRNQ